MFAEVTRITASTGEVKQRYVASPSARER